MAGQYRSIQGIKYERDLLDFAEAIKAQGRSMTKADAESLWDKAMDGNRVTDTEHRTIAYIVDQFKLEAAARTFLKAKLKGNLGNLSGGASSRSTKGGGGYYKTINGVAYDRKLLDEAEVRAVQQGGSLKEKDALELWGQAHDGRGVTECEKRTLKYIAEHHRLDAEARRTLEKVLKCKLHISLPIADGADGSAASSGLAAGLWQGFKTMVGSVTGSRKSPPRLQPLEDASRVGAESQNLGTKRSEPLPSLEDMLQANGGTAASAAKRQRVDAPVSHEDKLCPDLQKLLAELNGKGDGSILQLECPVAPPAAEEMERAAQRKKAQAEIDRILAARTASELLGTGSKEDQRREFKRLALLLHPDKGFVDHDDERAGLAMRLAMAALNRARQA